MPRKFKGFKSEETIVGHHCHAKGCTAYCQPSHLMCPLHWSMVPQDIRKRVKENYRRGQCDNKRVSPAWLKAAREAINYVADIQTKGALMEGAKL